MEPKLISNSKLADVAGKLFFEKEKVLNWKLSFIHLKKLIFCKLL
jgi:hypothetical protein